MTNRHLEIFVAVAENGKMSEAARKLYITQSSVSQAISEIEREYGILLFERLSHRLYITHAGEQFLSYARSIMAIQKDMVDYLNLERRSPRLRVGATVSVGICVISPIIERLKQLLPGLDVEVYVENTKILEDALLRNDLDIGLVEGDVSSPELVSKKSISDRLILICSNEHKFHGRKSVDVHELAGENLIMRENGSGTRALFESQIVGLHVPYNLRWFCSCPEAITTAVKYNHGISVISERIVQNDVKNGHLWACEISGLHLERSFDLVYHKNKYFSPAINNFIEVCNSYETYFPDSAASAFQLK